MRKGDKNGDFFSLFFEGKNKGDFLQKKRGQLTIFVIVSLVIVGLAVLAYLFFPRILVGLGISSENPEMFMQTCMENKINEVVEDISLQGGSLNPENYILYQDNKIQYLCYTREYYVPCVMQQPLLNQKIESEIARGVKNSVDECFDAMKKNFENQGYNVNLKKGETIIELLPKKISVTFNNDLTLTKDSAKRYEKINIFLDNNLYELTSIADSILNWEARYGNAETTIYMNYYHELKVEKLLQSEGSKIYILTNRNSGDKFQFASRSVVMPPGISGGVA